MPNTRLGFLGAGTIAGHHAKAARAEGASIEAACTRRPDSPNWERFRQAAPQVRQVATVDDLLDAPDVDAIVACLSWDVTPQHLERLLACDKPMLIEKPIALSLDEIPSGPHGNKIVGYNRRFYDVVNVLRERIAQGNLKAVDVTISENVTRHVERFGESIVPHVLEFASSHTLDLLLNLLGSLDVVHLVPETNPTSGFTSYNGLLVNSAGIPIVLALNENDPSPSIIRMRFSDHTMWVLSPLETLSVYHGITVVEPQAGSQVRRYEPNKVNEYHEDATFKPGFLQQMRAFLRGDYQQAATVDDSRQVLELIKEIRHVRSVSDIPPRARGAA